MGILCKIIRNEDNSIQAVEAPNGNESKLFKDLKQLDLSDQEALDAWTVASTLSFKNDILTPRINKHKTRIFNKLKNLTPKSNTINVVFDGKGTDVDITKLKYESVQFNGGVTVFAMANLNGNEERLGRIRLKRFRDGYKIDSSLLSDVQVYKSGKLESIKGNGVGTQLYKQVAQTLIKGGFPLYSDISATPEAEGVWNKFKALGIVTTEIVPKGRYFVIEAKPSSLDENGEPSAKDVLAYIQNVNNKGATPLTEAEAVDMSEALLNTNLDSSDKLVQEWDKMFFQNGGFEVTKAGIRKTNLYTKAEQDNILNSPELQESIRETYYKLKASPIVYNDLYADRQFMTIESTEPNIIGKFKSTNPFVMEKDAIKVLAGASTREEFESNLLDSDLEYLKESYFNNKGTESDIYFKISNYSNVPAQEIKEGELVNKVDNSVELLLGETLTDPSNTEIIEDLVYLQSINPVVWVNNSTDIKTVLKEFSKKSIDIGLDTVGIEDYYDVRTVDEFAKLFNDIDLFLNNQNEQTFNNLVETYRDFFAIEEQPAFETLNNVQGRAIYLETNKSAFELFSKFGLLPTGINLYRRVENSRDIEDVYESVYLNIVDNPFILPVAAYANTAIGEDGLLDRSMLNNLDNKSEVIEGIKTFVRSEITKIDSHGAIRDTDMLEKMYLYASFFNTDINNVKNSPEISGEISIMEQYPSNVKNLIGDYVAKFNKEYLREKLKDSDLFKDFYSNFEVTEKGIKMIDTDPLTMRRMMIELQDRKDLRNHLLLQKDSQIRPEQLEENFLLEDDTIMRNYYANYPTELNRFTDNYTTVDVNTLLAKTSDNFIRVDQGVFEMVDSYGDYSVFKRIQENNSNYKAYNKDFTKPVNELDLSSYGITNNDEGTEKTINNKYSAKQETNIDNEIDNCS